MKHLEEPKARSKSTLGELGATLSPVSVPSTGGMLGSVCQEYTGVVVDLAGAASVPRACAFQLSHRMATRRPPHVTPLTQLKTGHVTQVHHKWPRSTCTLGEMLGPSVFTLFTCTK